MFTIFDQESIKTDLLSPDLSFEGDLADTFRWGAKQLCQAYKNHEIWHVI